MTELQGQKSRVTFSMSRKYNVARYESVDLHVGLSTDVDGSIEDAFKKVEKQVGQEFTKLCDLLEKKYETGGK